MTQPTIALSKTTLLNLACLTSFWLILFWQLHYEWIYNNQYGYGVFVPFLGAYLLYLRCHDCPPVEHGSKAGYKGIATMLICAACLHYPLTIIFGANVDWRYALWVQASLVCLVTALMLIHWGGVAWLKHFSLPCAFFLMAVPWPRFIEISLVEGLMHFVASINVQILSFFGEFAHRVGNIVYLKTGPISIAEACSGVRSFQSTLMGGFFLGELLRLTWFKRITLIILAALASFIFNILRTCILAFIAIHKGPQYIDSWHDTAGYSVLFASFGVLAALAYVMKQMSVSSTSPAHHAINPSLNNLSTLQPYWYPCILNGLIITLLASSLGTTSAWYRWRHSHIQAQPSWHIQWPTQCADFKYIPISAALQETLFYTQGVNIQWVRTNHQRWLAYFFQWDCPQAAQLAGYHNPTRCMPAVGWVQQGSSSPLVWKKENLTLIFNTYTFKHQDKHVYVFSCQWDPLGYPFYQKIDREYEDRIHDVWVGNTQAGKQVLQIFLSNYITQEAAQADFIQWLDSAIILQAPEHSTGV